MKVNSAIISLFWNRFDFLIRFGYCRLGFLSKLFNRLLFWKLYSSDFEKLDKIFEDSLDILKKNNISIKDKTILEIGPGNSYIVAYNFLMHGAKKVVLIDKFPRITKTKRQREYFKREIDYIAKKYGQKPFFINSNEEIDTKYLQLIEGELIEANIQKADLIFTNSVLEHIKQMQESIWSMSSILNNNGYMLHNIDLRDHYNFNKPFLFYKYSDWTWNVILTKEGISYTNRLRYGDFVQLFQNAGLKTVFEKKRNEDLAATKLCSSFRDKSKESLEVTFLSVLLQKSTDSGKCEEPHQEQETE
ncbi:class I SAM-dependent methyltransferase [Chloroflexota bacterium]